MNNSIDNSVNENNNSSISHELQYLLSYKNSWSRQFSMKHPNKSIHTFTRPPLLEILSLLPIAYRVNSYLRTERKSLREPIFDLNGISMEPPNPGPYAGAPVGGIGTGAIGRGYKGEFKRYSLFPGRYVHRDIKANCFSVRIKNKELCYSKVLSTQKPDFLDTKIGNYHNNSDSYSNSHRNSHGNSNGSSQIHSCNDQYITDETCCTYYARFPISWTVYDNLLPGVKIIVKQLCPFLPNNYCESSLPVGVFDVQVEIDNSKFRSCRNNSDENSADTIEVSVLFCFQNGYDDEKDRTATCYSTEQFPAHSYFSSENRSTTQNSVNREKDTGVVHGIIMPNRREQFPCKDKATVNSFDVGSFSIATVEPSTSHSNMNSVGNDITTTVSFCRKIITGETMHKQSSAFTRAFERTCDWSTESTDETKSLRTTSTTATPLDTSPLSPSSQSSADDFSMNSIWRSFVDEGVLPESIENYDSKFLNSYKDKRLLYGSALCVKKVINILNANETIENGASSVHFVFGLSWDNPIARFGSNIGLPRFYTR